MILCVLSEGMSILTTLVGGSSGDLRQFLVSATQEAASHSKAVIG